MRIELLVRPRLLHSLQAALQSGHVLITAPAGYGKTVLLRSLAAHRLFTYYLPLAPADADLPHLQERLGEVPQAAQRQPQTTLLLDDVHHLERGPEALHWLVGQLRHDVPRLVLAGRWVPGPAVWDQVRKGELAHLDADDLAFTRAESQAFLEQHYADTPELVAAWHERTGGWPLALGLLARVRAAPDPRPVAEAELFTYLARTLVQTLPAELLHFWTLTAVPLCFNDELAAVLLGEDEDPVALRQEIQHHNLFLEPAEQPGWFRYHELIREFLLQQAEEDLRPVFQQIIVWFEARGDLEMAIEHALAGGLHQRAAQLILALPERFVWDSGRYLTYRRWVYGLTESARAANPELLIRLGTYLQQITDMRSEASALLKEALRLAKFRNDTETRQRVLGRMARLHYQEGEYNEALAYLRLLLEDPTCQGQQRLDALHFAAPTLSELARFQEAQEAYLSAIGLARELGDVEEEMLSRTNLALSVLIPRGQFKSAQQHMDVALSYFKDSPGRYIFILLHRCELYTATGDWDRLSATLQQIETLMAEVEAQNVSHLLWQAYYLGILFTSRGIFDEARASLVRASGIAEEYPMAQVCIAWIEAWLHRRQGQFMQAVQRAEATLAEPLNVPFYRAVLALELDIARGMLWLAGELAGFSLHPETQNLIRWRAGAELVRLRALLALCAYHGDDPRWCRHVQAALLALRRPGYEHLLTRRDPELGAHFWTLVLAEGVATGQAIAALQAIGNPEPVLSLLAHQEPRVRVRAAQATAAIGCEEAMPALTAALAAEGDKKVAAALKKALAHLQSRPPPPLKVKLLGDFVLRRGEQPVPDEAWQRPVVRRLFQYFALHRGKPLPRDRILDDLWPRSDPQKAWATFRTVYSRMRHVLEPHMRPKSPSRYVAVEGDVYCFDPSGVVHVDTEAFEATVRHALSIVGEADVPPLPEDLLAALEGWEPLLPELPYEEWLLEARERLHGLYVEGCLYVAQSLLIRGRPREAIVWARRTVRAAPWLEEGYQALMRAHARQGQRGLALKTYGEAMEALRRELDVEPSPLTQWLAERLRQGKAI